MVPQLRLPFSRIFFSTFSVATFTLLRSAGAGVSYISASASDSDVDSLYDPSTFMSNIVGSLGINDQNGTSITGGAASNQVTAEGLTFANSVGPYSFNANSSGISWYGYNSITISGSYNGNFYGGDPIFCYDGSAYVVDFTLDAPTNAMLSGDITSNGQPVASGSSVAVALQPGVQYEYYGGGGGETGGALDLGMQAGELLFTASGSTWTADADGDWSNSSNWSGSVPDGSDAFAYFGPAITATRLITVNAPQTVGTIYFNSSNSYKLVGTATVSMNVSSGQAAIYVVAGSHGISAPLVLDSDTTFTISPYTSTLTISNLQASTANLTKAGSGKLMLNSLQANSLNVTAGIVEILAGDPTASTLNRLTIAPDATLDVTSNSLIVHGGPLSDITALVASGYDGGIWDGTGITSSQANGDTALGVLLNNNGTGIALYSAFEGQPTGVNDVLVKYTYYGDTNLDGKVDGTDYSRIDSGFLNQASGWQDGDFNYDGVIDGSDYTLIDNAYNTQGAQQSAEFSFETTAEIAMEKAVPEPALAGFLGTAFISLRRRRRR